MADKFKPGDRVFAKIKGWPPWPAKVNNRADGKAEAYLIQFYGTYDTSTVKRDSMFIYNEENKAKYGKTKNTAHWKEAMEEIENNTPIGDSGPLVNEEEAEIEQPGIDIEQDTDGDGELMIDEGPSNPPVLSKEGGKSAATNGKAEQPKGRRNSKASISKRDSINSTSSIPEVTTPASATPATELVSRSGRKIKPKRFADDELPSSRTSVGGKGGPGTPDDGSEGPPTKRAKRAPKTPPVKPTLSPTPPEPKETPVAPATRPRMVIGKGRGVPPKPAALGRVSPDISSPMPRAPALKPATRKSEAAATPAKKALPALIPAVVPNPQPVAQSVKVKPIPASSAVFANVLPGRRIPSLRHQQFKQQQVEEKEDEEMNEPPMLALNTDETEVEADDKENVKDSAASSNDSDEGDIEAEGESELESEMEKNSEMDDASSRYSESMDETKIPFTDKDGQELEIHFENRVEFESVDDRMEYENTLETIVKIKEDLEQGDADPHDTIQEILESCKDEFDPEAQTRERRAIQIRLLRMEGEVIEIIGEIVSCLSEKHAECFRALELLERLAQHELTPLILKKHPEVVTTIGKLRTYVGNCENWDMTDDQLIEFEEGAKAIRIRASDIYSSFYTIFIPPEEQDATVPFEEIFEEEMKVFGELTRDLSMDNILGLTAETTGGFETFETGEIET